MTYSLGVLEDFFSQVLGCGATIFSVEFNTKIFIWTAWIVARRQNDTSKAVVWGKILVEFSYQS